MSYTFYQSTGEFCSDSTSQCTPSYSGYKGETDQTKKNSGPAPVGKYTIGNRCDKQGERCNLIPDPSNNMFGRFGIQIHGDSSKGDKSASHGCIILNQKDRGGLKTDDTIIVKEKKK